MKYTVTPVNTDASKATINIKADLEKALNNANYGIVKDIIYMPELKQIVVIHIAGVKVEN